MRLDVPRAIFELRGQQIFDSALIGGIRHRQAGFVKRHHGFAGRVRCAVHGCDVGPSAIGALRAIYNAKLLVPDDISVIGFDDIDFSQYTQPPLTTIRLSRAKLAEKAFDALATVISGESQKGREYDVETHLVVRSSTGRNREHRAV